ncbi:MAG: hypothetical protein ACJ71Z_09005 [Aeromicrobium sp.]
MCLLAASACGADAGAKRTTRSGSRGWTELAAAAPLAGLHGNARNAIAWAPLADPDDVVVEGSVPSSRAWSTSKVLVIAAYLDAVVDGDPDKVPAATRALIRAALTRSDERSIMAIHQQIPSTAAAMTKVLRSIGDRTTVPTAYEGTMQWNVREQVRFMAALGNGRVVSQRASAYLLQQMQPIGSQRWGLGTIGARAFKPGWMGRDESRQMGIVDAFAVAIITTEDGPRGLGDPADYAHAVQLTRLAQLLSRRIEQAQCLLSYVPGWIARWCLTRTGP